jgi:hypothetical protein
MRTSRSLSTRVASLGGALALAASGLVGAVGLVATAAPAGATTTQLGTSNCILLVGTTPTPTPITPSVTAVISPSPVSAGGSFNFSSLSLVSTLDPAANPALVNVAGSTLSIQFSGTLSATGATPASQAVVFSGSVAVPKPFDHPVQVSLAGATGNFTASASGATSATVLLSGTGSLVAAVVGTQLSFNGPCTGGAPTQIASVPVVQPAAFVTNVIPNAGLIAGGTMVKIVGQNLGGPLSVSFGDTPATSFQSISPNVIEAVAPAITTDGNTTHTPVDIKVVTGAGPPTLSALDTFTYVDPTLGAIVTMVTPAVGPNSGGTPVTIAGIGFDDLGGGPASDVHFGSVDQPTFTVVSDTEITTTAPAGMGVVDVTVTGNDGVTQSPTSPQDRYNYAPGYLLSGSDGGVFSFGQVPGQANFFGSAGGLRLNKPIVGMALTPDGGGYYRVGSDGGVFAYGDARFYGSAGNLTLNKPVVGIASTPDGAGYWLVASDGGIFAYGDALYRGSTGGTMLAAPIVGMAATSDPMANGYWLVGADGGVFAYGTATFAGSAGGTPLAAPVVGMTPNPTGSGYWLAGADGGVFAYGQAKFNGSLHGTALASPISGIAATSSGQGYWMFAKAGAVFHRGDAGFYGDVAGITLNGPIVGFGAVQSQVQLT